jgi:hypothetical protein
MENKERNWTVPVIFAAIIIIIAIILYGYPRYKVWQQGLEGQAELARAEQNRKIAVQEAEAKKESAKALAEAEIIRAKGVAKANMIIGESLKNNGSYLRYLWIQTLNDNPQNVIYVPTEAGLPILEAGKRADIRYDNMQTEFNVEMQEFEQY